MHTQTRLHIRLLALTGLLLLVCFSRIFWTSDLNFSSDEVRTATRAQGSILQTILWQPPDWPPLHSIAVVLWSHYISDHPAMLRASSFFFLLPAIALMFQLGRRIFHDEQGALLSAVAFATVGYFTYLSGWLRGYGLALALFVLLVYLTVRYFDDETHDSLPLAVGVTIALIFYTTYTAIFALGALGLYTVLRYRWQIRRWLVPGIGALVIALPQMLSFASTVLASANGAEAPAANQLPFLLDAAADVYQTLLGNGWLVWFGLIAVAIALLARQSDSHKRMTAIWFMLLVLIAPLLIYGSVAASIFRVFDERYLWWMLVPIALVIGGGFAHVRREAALVVAGLMAILLFFPTPYNFTKRGIPYEATFQAVADQMQTGDVMVVDPAICTQVGCDFFHVWTYYTDFYFGERLPIVQEPGDHQRVWYVHRTEFQDLTLEAAVNFWRVEGERYGVDRFSVQRFSAPPDPQGVLFENGLRFHGMEFLADDGKVLPAPVQLREQNAVTVRLWWSVDAPLTNDYSVSVQLMDQTPALVAQDDRAPQLVHLNPEIPYLLPQTMTEWQPEQLYVSERTLRLPALDTPIDADAFLVVYQWWDGVRIASDANNEQGQLPLAAVRILGW